MDITHHALRIMFDIYFVGVGGQGVLTIGEIITTAAFQKGIPVNFYPTKGMAQRGGFVKAQLRLGRASVGPSIPEKGADLIIATEVSELLKAVRFIKPSVPHEGKPGGDVMLFGFVWPPTAVMLGKAPYPTLEQVTEQVQAAGGNLHHIAPERLPVYEGAPVPDNIYVLGAALAQTRLCQLLAVSDVAGVVRNRWKRGVERNLFALEAGVRSQTRRNLAWH